MVAHVVMLGAYLLAILASMALVASPWVEWLVLGRVDLAVFAVVAVGVVLFRLLVPDPVRFEAAGPRVERDDQPQLWDVLDKVASATRQPMPEEVYLLDQMNVYVTEIGGFLGIGGRRVMGLGMPLMSVVDPEELGAVLAHEFGHLNRETGFWGARVYLTRQAVVRQVLDARPTWIRRPLMSYARRYLRATRPLARQQELSADAVAAAATSVRAMAATLALLPFGTAAYDTYYRTEYLPLLESGRRPPLLEGFESFLTSSLAREHVAAVDQAALGSSTGSDLDAHPSIGERLVALGVERAGFDERALPEVRSTALLRDVDEIEEALARRHVDDDAVLEPIAWSEVGDEILLPGWRRDRIELVGDLPAGFHLGALPLDRDGLAELGADVANKRGVEVDRAGLEALGHRASRAIIGELAVERGLGVEMVPGEPVWFGRPPEQFGLFAAYDAVVAGHDHPRLWYQLLDEAGLAPVTPVAPVAPAPVAPGAAPPPARAPVPTAPAATAPTPGAQPAPAPTPAASAPTAGPPPAAAPAPAPRAVEIDPLGGHRRKVFRVPAPMGRHHELILDGDTLRWRGHAVSADEVSHVAYWSGDDAEVRIWVDDEVSVRVRLSGGQKAKDVTAQAWEAAVAWADSCIIPRLLDRCLARMSERGRVQIGDQIVTTTGVVVRGRVVPWSLLTGAALSGRTIEIRQKADGSERGAVVATLDASEPNMVLVPPLMVAASAASRTTPTAPAR